MLVLGVYGDVTRIGSVYKPLAAFRLCGVALRVRAVFNEVALSAQTTHLGSALTTPA